MNNMPKGIVSGGLNDKMDILSVQNYKATLNTKDRIAILKPEKLIVKLHYSVPGVGTMYCFEGDCCKRFGPPKVRYIYPIIKYPTDKNGNIVDSGEPEIMMLSVTYQKNNLLITINETLQHTGLDITKIDLLFLGSNKSNKIETKDSNGKDSTIDWVDYDIMNSNQKISWMRPEWKNLIKDQAAFYKGNIFNSIAREIGSDESLLQIINQYNSNGVSNSFVATPISNSNSAPRGALVDNTQESPDVINDKNVDINTFFNDDDNKQNTPSVQQQEIKENKHEAGLEPKRIDKVKDDSGIDNFNLDL